MTQQEIIEKINADIAEEFEISVESITPEADIRETLKYDSMRALQIVIIVKRHTGVLIPPRHIPRFTTFQTLYEYITNKEQKNE